MLLSEVVLPGAISISSSPNLVDFHLFTLKPWRNVYHYNAKGRLTGWTRRRIYWRHRIHGGWVYGVGEGYRGTSDTGPNSTL